MKLGHQLQVALADALTWHEHGKPYFWKLKSMQKLTDMGLAERWVVVGEPNGYTLTPAGIEAAKQARKELKQ
jgi:hypothetical protein